MDEMNGNLFKEMLISASTEGMIITKEIGELTLTMNREDLKREETNIPITESIDTALAQIKYNCSNQICTVSDALHLLIIKITTNVHNVL